MAIELRSLTATQRTVKGVGSRVRVQGSRVVAGVVSKIRVKELKP